MFDRQGRIIWYILVSICLVRANERAELKIKFVYYVNPDGVAGNGACCETPRIVSFVGCSGLMSSCDTQFLVEVYQLVSGGRTLIKSYYSRIWENTNEIAFTSVFGSQAPPNPAIFNLSYWDNQYGYELTITVFDKDQGTADDLIVHWSKTYKRLGETSHQFIDQYRTRLNVTISGNCKEGYYGEDCRTPCSPQESFTCDQRTGDKVCRPGYAGNRCEDIKECSSSPCRYGATCTDEVNHFTCQCTPGYTGRFCEIDIDFCGEKTCNNGVCIEQRSNYRCQCAAGFTGTQCDINIDECNSDPCQNNGICQDGDNGYTCSCAAGYTGDICERDIDECQSEQPLCQNGGSCQNIVNGFVCSCPPGFYGSVCDTNPDDCRRITCKNHGTCVDGLDSFHCNCAAGYTGQLCETQVNKCEEPRCSVYGSCIDTFDDMGYRCQCQTGYTGSLCDINIDDCQSQPCQNNATCHDLVSAFLCLCKPGYTGTYCEDGCALQCVTGQGICTAGSTGALDCSCLPGYSGSNCETNINECDSNPCDGSECIDLLYGYRCDTDDKCLDNALAISLASSFCVKIMREENCDSLIRLENVTGDNMSCFMLHSFKCSSLSFMVNFSTDNFTQISTNWQETSWVCNWEFGDITCLEVNSSVTSVEGNMFCLNQTKNGQGARVPMVDVLNITELLTEYWYYFTLAGVVVITMIISTIICISTKPQRRKRTENISCSRVESRPPLPSLPLPDQIDHEYEGMIYHNPTNSICSPLSIDDPYNPSGTTRLNCSETCNIYEEPFQKRVPLMGAAKENTFGKRGSVDGRKLTEYYTEPMMPLLPHGAFARPVLASDNVLYAVPDSLPHPPPPFSTSQPPVIQTTLPPPPWLNPLPLPLPPHPDIDKSMQDTIYNTLDRSESLYDAINEPDKSKWKRCINPLYSVDEREALSPQQERTDDTDHYVDAECSVEQCQPTSVKDRVATLQMKSTTNADVPGRQVQVNPVYSINEKRQLFTQQEKKTTPSSASTSANMTITECTTSAVRNIPPGAKTVGLVKSKKSALSLKSRKKGKKSEQDKDEAKQPLEKKVNPLYYLTELKAKTSGKTAAATIDNSN